MTKQNPYVGSHFGDFLKEEGIYEEVTARAVERVRAWQKEQATNGPQITQGAGDGAPDAARGRRRATAR